MPSSCALTIDLSLATCVTVAQLSKTLTRFAFSIDPAIIKMRTSKTPLTPVNGQARKTTLPPHFLHQLPGHTAIVTCLAFFPDGLHLVSGSWDKTAQIWDASTGAVIHVLGGHNDLVRSVAFSPDNRYVISGSYDKTIRVWNVETGESVCNLLKGHSS